MMEGEVNGRSVKGSATRGLTRGARWAPVNQSGATPRACGQRILFTGPDGIGNYRAKLADFTRSIGVGPLSAEATSDLSYLFRAAPHSPAPLRKQCYVGGVGWAVQYGSTLNSTTLLSNKQIKLGEFRLALENRASHRCQNSRYVSSCVSDRQQAGAHGRLAWDKSVYESYNQGNNKQALLSKRHEALKEKAEESLLSAITFPAITRANAQ